MLILTWAYGSNKGSEIKTGIMADTAKVLAATEATENKQPLQTTKI
jgi:hypothetical protein